MKIESNKSRLQSTEDPNKQELIELLKQILENPKTDPAQFRRFQLLLDDVFNGSYRSDFVFQGQIIEQIEQSLAGQEVDLGLIRVFLFYLKDVDDLNFSPFIKLMNNLSETTRAYAYLALKVQAADQPAALPDLQIKKWLDEIEQKEQLESGAFIDECLFPVEERDISQLSCPACSNPLGSNDNPNICPNCASLFEFRLVGESSLESMLLEQLQLMMLKRRTHLTHLLGELKERPEQERFAQQESAALTKIYGQIKAVVAKILKKGGEIRVIQLTCPGCQNSLENEFTSCEYCGNEMVLVPATILTRIEDQASLDELVSSYKGQLEQTVDDFIDAYKKYDGSTNPSVVSSISSNQENNWQYLVRIPEEIKKLLAVLNVLSQADGVNLDLNRIRQDKQTLVASRFEASNSISLDKEGKAGARVPDRARGLLFQDPSSEYVQLSFTCGSCGGSPDFSTDQTVWARCRFDHPLAYAGFEDNEILQLQKKLVSARLKFLIEHKKELFEIINDLIASQIGKRAEQEQDDDLVRQLTVFFGLSLNSKEQRLTILEDRSNLSQVLKLLRYSEVNKLMINDCLDEIQAQQSLLRKLEVALESSLVN